MTQPRRSSRISTAANALALCALSFPAAAQQFRAEFSPGSYAVGERIPLRIGVRNPLGAELALTDPARDLSALTLRVRRNGGAEEALSPAALHPRAGNVRVISQPVQLAPGGHVDFDFDLADLGKLRKPGEYAAAVEYRSKAGASWRSEVLAFRILKPSVTYLSATPDEATASGLHAVVWMDNGRLLRYDYASPGEPAVAGASLVTADATGASIAVASAPPLDPNSGRWIAVLRDGNVTAWFEGARRSFPFAADALIAPALAGSRTGEAAPACWFGGYRGSTFRMVSSSGKAVSVALSGPVLGAWAATAARRSVFVFALKQTEGLRVSSVECSPAGVCGPEVRWAGLAGEFVAGGVRLVGGEVYAAMLSGLDAVVLSRSKVISRAALSGHAGSGAIRLDERGRPHVLLVGNGGGVRYVGPDGGPVTVPDLAAPADLILIKGQPPALAGMGPDGVAIVAAPRR